MKIIYVFLSLLISTTSLAFDEHNQNATFTGKAYDTKTNTLAYEEAHSYKLVNGKKVMHSRFTSPDGSLIAERNIEYQDDNVMSYELIQDNIEYSESVIRTSDNVRLEERDGGDVGQKEIKLNNDIIIDAGFSDYIVRNWDMLDEGETLKFDFASVSQMNKIRLQVKMADINKTSAKEYSVDDEIVMFKMTIASPILKMFIKPIEVGYYKESRQLAYYKGISNIKNSNGKQYSSVRIEYSKVVNAG